MTQFNPKIFRGNRVRVSLQGYSGVSRIWIWNKIKNRYEPPLRGGSYFARKPGSARMVKVFATRAQACEWVRGNSDICELDPLKSSYCIKDLLVDWQKHAWPTFRETTRIFYGKTVVLFEPILDVEVEKLSPAVIDKWLTDLKSPPYVDRFRETRRNFHKEIQCLKTMVNWYRERNDETKLVLPFKKRHLFNPLYDVDRFGSIIHIERKGRKDE